jgi:cytoskeletal protein CcmA (bactofilin family)
MSANSSEDQHLVPRFSSDPLKLDGPGRAVQFHPDVPHRVVGANAQAPASAPDEIDSAGKLLTVGKDMALKGAEISDCDRLFVEGMIDGHLTSGRYLEIDYGGTFKGTAVVDNAEIAGTFEGDLRVHNRLSVHASGVVIGRIRYGQLEVERGGRLNGEAEHDGGNREADLQTVDDESPAITFSTPAAASKTD